MLCVMGEVDGDGGKVGGGGGGEGRDVQDWEMREEEVEGMEREKEGT